MISIDNLFKKKENQTIIISGESGAGKTESAKLAIKCITKFFELKHKNNREFNNICSANEKIYNNVQTLNMFNKENNLLEEKIRKCSEILEAFGNAKTVQNDNSSRFGKYTKIYINIETCNITGAEINTYLLEKSRVIEPSASERNFHIFYFLLCGASPPLLQSLFLTSNASDYKYLSISKLYQANSINDSNSFFQLIEAFKILNFSEEEIEKIFKIVSTILLIGNLEFDLSLNDEKETSTHENTLKIKNKDIFSKICSLLNCEPEILEKSFLFRAIYLKVESKLIFKPFQLNEAAINKNTFSKELYDKLFKWIVKKLNESLAYEDISKSSNLIYVGLLDIFGFECFENNSFEQFCINYTNEKLQQIFIFDVFKADEEEFKNEGLGEYLSEIKYSDNKGVIELMDNEIKQKIGIFQLIDDKSQMLSSDDDMLYNDIIKRLEKNKNLKYNKLKKRVIEIIHTAKNVEYNLNGFINKNKDKVEISLLKIMQNIDLINWNMQNDIEIDRDKFLGLKFRVDIAKLIAELNSCNRHYIRCLKPNQVKKKEFLIPSFLFNQIKYLGILDSIRIRRENYPKRMAFKDFYMKYHEYLSRYKPKSNDPQKSFIVQTLNESLKKDQKDPYFIDGTITILDEFFKDRKFTDCLIGRTKIYMMHHFFSKIEKELKNMLKIKGDKINIIKNAYIEHKLAKKLFSLRILMIRIFLRRQGMKKKYKEMCKNRIMEFIRTSYYNKFILEYKKNLILRKFSYINYIRRIKGINRAKEAFKIGQHHVKFILEKLYNKIKRKEYNSIVVKILKSFFIAKIIIKEKTKIFVFDKFKDILKIRILKKKLIKKIEAQKIIARNYLSKYLKKKVINKRIVEYILEDKKERENILLKTELILFPHLANKKIQEVDVFFNDVNPNNHANDTNKLIITDNILNPFDKKYKNKAKTPIFDNYGEPKIMLFAKILNIDTFVIIITKYFSKMFHQYFFKHKNY